MIDLTFETYTEAAFSSMTLVETYEMQNWLHHVIKFEGSGIPENLIDPEALIITNHEGNILQIVLREEGCDSPLFQFTENEKSQLEKWFNENWTK
ncbi:MULTISPECIES: hypothetical protein [Alkalihalophilus]|uniref:Uncharacterized protein n=2 Tax=Alkalihalophilus TaxID=2893060 RepID=A0AAJ2NKZ2_ALKPS|nr:MULTISPECIES: hypothetical protein [Alkalihalophilus]ERN53462.1 hypothetical protein A33I_11365 [Alkalihalophilus marmarensis DSM 21297]MCM3490904.1 hypothetical protein [Alkalihalophilus marmarensis]MDV2885082.1 hypothetical protein [Alkalihalophilus pseudofirmus]MEC2073641.1 hypothetical protein [Alkalihalophilus marmarensis]OLS37655.1 hypothetical protein BTR22_09340 [Alkalihalophilus pseudofirmus]